MSGVTIANGVVATDPANGGSFTDPTITGGSINGTHIGNITPSDGAFTTLNATSANVLGPLAAEGLNSTSNGQVASPTNTGMSFGPTLATTTFFDATRPVDDRGMTFLWNGGLFSANFRNDAGNATVTWVQIVGGHASGISSILSNSGSGSWTHNGVGFYSAVSSGNGIRLNGSASGGVPAITTDGVNGNVSLLITTKGTGGITLDRATTIANTLSVQDGLRVTEGSNARQGTATLVAGTVTVSNTSVTANSRIFLTPQSLGTVTRPAAVGVTARVVGTSFTITSSDATDTSVIAYEIFEPG